MVLQLLLAVKHFVVVPITEVQFFAAVLAPEHFHEIRVIRVFKLVLQQPLTETVKCRFIGVEHIRADVFFGRVVID